MVSLSITGVGCLDSGTTCTKGVSSKSLGYVDKTKLASDIVAIDEYLDAQSIIAVEDQSGLRYVIHEAGTGKKKPCIESYITVNYEGKILNGSTPFDKSTSPVSFPLSGLIVGWQIAFTKFTAGTSATLYIPSGYGYGPNAQGSIPANSILVFDVELVEVN